MIIVIDGHEYHQTYTPWKTGEHLNSSPSRTRAQDGFVSNEQKNVSTFMEVNNFDSYIIHIYIYYIHTYIYILCTWVCPTMRQCTTCINLNRENNDQP